VLLELACESFLVESEFAGIPAEHIDHLFLCTTCPVLLAPIEQIVHLPELALSTRGFGAFGSDHGFVVNRDQWEVTIDYAHSVRVSVFQTL